MTDRLREAAARWQAARRAAVVVEVAAARGSVPRGAGTRMLVAEDEVAGTIGGGHLEWQAIALARRMLASEAAGSVERDLALGPSLGQCCGGTVRLRLAPLGAENLQAWPCAPERFFLQLHGAGHVGRAIIALLRGIACQVQWIDGREAPFPAEPLPPHIEALCVDAVEAEVARAPAGACFLVMTHSHALDLAIVEAILRRDDFAWAGLIGSRTKRASFAQRLRARGVEPSRIERLACPIGLPGIAGKEPEVIAVATVAQLLALRR